MMGIGQPDFASDTPDVLRHVQNLASHLDQRVLDRVADQRYINTCTRSVNLLHGHSWCPRFQERVEEILSAVESNWFAGSSNETRAPDYLTSKQWIRVPSEVLSCGFLQQRPTSSIPIALGHNCS